MFSILAFCTCQTVTLIASVIIVVNIYYLLAALKRNTTEFPSTVGYETGNQKRGGSYCPVTISLFLFKLSFCICLLYICYCVLSTSMRANNEKSSERLKRLMGCSKE